MEKPKNGSKPGEKVERSGIVREIDSKRWKHGSRENCGS